MLLEIKNLRAKIGDKEILKGVDLTVRRGEVHVIYVVIRRVGVANVVPALVGLVVGLAFHFFRHNQVNVKQTEVD